MAGKRTADHLIGPGLRAAGFRKERSLYVAEFPGGILGSVGLNTASTRSPHGSVTVLPVLGVAHERVEAWMSELLELSGDGGVAPVTRPLPTLLESGQAGGGWTLGMNDAEGTASALLGEFVAHGLPWMKRLADLEMFLDELRTGYTNSWTRPRAIPVVLALLGRRDEAEAAIEAKCAEYGDSEFESAVEYRAFAARLRDHMRSRDASDS